MVDRTRILVVDDDPALLETTAALLSFHYDVTVASSGAEALALFAAAPCDIICTDFRMPGMDGVELLRRARDVHADVCGVVITALRQLVTNEPEHCSLLFKPYDPGQLLARLKQAEQLAGERRAKRTGAS